MKLAHILTAAALTIGASACTKPPADPPGVEKQPTTYHPERNPAQLPTTSAPTAPAVTTPEDPAQMPVQEADSQGTVRTPAYVDDVPAAKVEASPRPSERTDTAPGTMR